ncbi:MAG: Tat pathway signal protein [Actinobacteria bacterium]|nr:Tat pathway signal protein [Actinomycetota bacterium]
MASREHRLHHWLWHEVRNNWLSYPEDVQEQIREKGWEPPRPALNERRRPILDNDSGEDFLYMHRRMLIDANRMLAQLGDPNYPRIRVWTQLPAPGDDDFPVPPPWIDPTQDDDTDRRTAFDSIQRLKTDIFYQKRLVTWQRIFTDPAFLRGISLGELGTLMEQSIHASMHMRWATAPAGFRPDPGPTEGFAIKELWDDPRFDFLGDTYSSHVNPVFWSLHGWVDDRVEDWKSVNGVYGNAFWQGTWDGNFPGDEPPGPASDHARSGLLPEYEDPTAGAPGVHAVLGGPEHHHPAREGMEEMVTIIGKCGIFHAGYTRASFLPVL